MRGSQIPLVVAADTDTIEPDCLVSSLANEAVKGIDLSGISKGLARTKIVGAKNTSKGNFITIEGKKAVNFASYSYLGFDQHPAIAAAVFKAVKTFGTTTAATRVYHECDMLSKLEDEIAGLVGSETALVTLNVTLINLSVIPALFSGPDAYMFVDKNAHATIKAGTQQAMARGSQRAFVDATNLETLEETLRIVSKKDFKRKVLLVDGVYSIHGHILDLPAIQKMCRTYNTILYIDDAHGFGVYGAQGGGICDEFFLPFDNLIYTASLLKGVGANGGFIAGNKDLIDVLRKTALCFIFSDPISPISVAAARAAIKLSCSLEGRKRRRKLRTLASYVRNELTNMGYLTRPGDSPVIPVEIGSDEDVFRAYDFLLENGIYVNPMVHPGVPKGQGTLRISLNANHTETCISKFLNTFRLMKQVIP